MSGQQSSCCGACEEAATEPVQPKADTTNQVAAGNTEAHETVSRDRRPSGFIQAIRRLLGTAEGTERA